jgi:hypothetical protein
MCTLSYIPITEKDFIFTTNRDEDPRRIALAPEKHLHGDIELIYPKDSKAKGSWIISNGVNATLCLLNGAFEKHHRKKTYRQSRGLILLDFYHFSNLKDFIDNYQFEGLESFTLIIVENKPETALTEIIWNEKELFVKMMSNSQAYIWSSSTLYTSDMRAEREAWFWDWLSEKPHISPDTVLNFHKTGGDGNLEYGLFMNRNNQVRTVSITQILGGENGHTMLYFDFLEEKSF